VAGATGGDGSDGILAWFSSPIIAASFDLNASGAFAHLGLCYRKSGAASAAGFCRERSRAQSFLDWTGKIVLTIHFHGY